MVFPRAAGFSGPAGPQSSDIFARAVLGSVLEAYRDRRDQVNSQAQAIRRLVDTHSDEGAQGPVSPRALEDAERQIARAFDRKNDCKAFVESVDALIAAINGTRAEGKDQALSSLGLVRKICQ